MSGPEQNRLVPGGGEIERVSNLKASMPANSRKLEFAYEQMIANGVLSQDPAQREAVVLLAKLSFELEQNQRSKNGFAKFFGQKPLLQKGLYIWGGVGQGKTLLMDMFYQQVSLKDKRRVHFHEFMDELHRNIAIIRQNYSSDSINTDPVTEAVKPIIKSTSLLCFDEFHVSDITNAMLLGRLFEKLFDGGVVMVATSNVKPDDLYKNGLNRQLFLPFIKLMKSHCDILHLGAQKDYRLDKLSSQPVFHFGTREHTARKMKQHWQMLTGQQATEPGKINVLGREIIIPSMAMGCARFEFEDLCEQPLGARDYLAIAHEFHTLVIKNIPRFEKSNSNAAKRFIILIDTLYDQGVKLVASFDTNLENLGNDKNTAFEFRRTVSRLNEMASLDYLAKGKKSD